MNRTLSNWAALAVGTAVSLTAAFAAYQLANYSLHQLIDYRSPYAAAPIPATSTPETEVPAGNGGSGRRVVYITVDGLREDTSRELPTLNSLRKAGFDAVVRTGEPSLSFPTWTTLFSGAGQRVSGVTTNWFEERVPVETLFDVAVRQDVQFALSATTEFETLYGVKRSPHVLLRDWDHGTYMTGEMVDGAISLAKESSATLVFLHCPDIDEAGHEFGGASEEYLETARKVDADIGRLVTALRDDRTTFVVAADHGHLDKGGHGGWESAVREVPAIFAGPGVALGSGEGGQEQVAPTVALLAGLAAPRHAVGEPLAGVAEPALDDARFRSQRAAALAAYARVVSAGSDAPSPVTASLADATRVRAARERAGRLPVAVALALAAIASVAAIGVLSWRALVASLAGTAFYYLAYNALFFVAHGHRWSLSAFNTEENMQAFFNGRMIEAVIAALLAAVVAGEVYLALRSEPKRPRGEYLPGWLALGTATVVTIQSTLVLQVAWFLWYWGARITWLLPDLMWGFKYDLDLIQGTALGAAVLLAPIATWAVGRFHPFPPGAHDATPGSRRTG